MSKQIIVQDHDRAYVVPVRREDEEFYFDPVRGIVPRNPLDNVSTGQILAELQHRKAISFTGYGDGSFMIEDDL